MTDFCNLHNHSHYSILQALASPKELFMRAKELGQKSIAVSDYGTMSGIWDCYKLANDDVKFIPGCEFFFTDDVNNKSEKLRNIVLLAKNAVGYKNLLTLHRAGFDCSSMTMKKVIPVIDWKLLKQYADGLICLTGCGNGVIGQLINTKKIEEAEKTLIKLIEIFGENLGAEIQAHNHISNPTTYRGGINQIFTNSQVIGLAKKYNVRIIPTSNTHYAVKGEHDINDVLQAIGSMQPVYSNNRLKFNTQDLYLKSGDEIKAFFARNYGDDFAEEICKNTIVFADMCEKSDWVDPKFSNPIGKELPVFPVKNEKDYSEFLTWLKNQSDEIKKLEEDKNYLRYKCELAFKTMVPSGKEEIYRRRLEEELDTFYYCGVASYLLITADFLEWARNNKVSCGPGRGSAGGSLAAYLLNIHKADPIKYGLVFERFFNKKRTAMADIDNDFSKAGRGKVIDYVINKYGKENVSQITNINTITPKVYIKDLARSYQLGGSSKAAVELGTMVADFISADIKTIDQAQEKSPLFAEAAKRNIEFLKYKKICNKPRAAGCHAAGILIGNRPIKTIAPVRTDKDNTDIVEFDKDRSEEAGLIKIDLLGIETLDIIELTEKLIREQGKEVPQIDIEAYDQKTYELITRGNTLCVFQFGSSGGTIDLCRKIKPKSIEDLAIITTLARPSSREIRTDFIKVREGAKKSKLLHPSLERAMKDTYGFSIYDESLLTLSKDVAGWDLAEADKLRKLTKEKGKNPEKAKKWREEFIKGSIDNGVEEKIAIQIWEDIIEKYALYSFNKSHAVLYSMLSYHTAYLKAHFPIEFLLANLKSELSSNAVNSAENAGKIKAELRKLGKKILSPNINSSEISYKIVNDDTLLTGLEAIKFLGDDAMEEILAKRPFTSFDDFMLRVEAKKMRATAIQALIAAGAMDCFNLPRKLMYLYSADYRTKLQVWKKKHNTSIEKFNYEWPGDKEWSLPELYALEFKYLGETFICGKREAYKKFFDGSSMPIKIIKKMQDKEELPAVKAEIKSIFEFKVKKETSKNVGQDMMKCILEDEYGDQIGATFFVDTLKGSLKFIKDNYGNKYKLDVGTAISFNGSINIYNDEVGIAVKFLTDIAPPPALPKDLKVKKTVKKTNKSITSKPPKSSDKVEDIISSLEDDLYENGMIDLEKEIQDI